MTVLKALDDTTFSETLENYQRIIELEGFKRVLDVSFNSARDGSTVVEHFFIYFKHDEGVLLVFDTYNGTKVNGGSFYYNWRPAFDPGTSGQPYPRVTSNGGYTKDGEGWVWAGDHDCREAVRFHLRRLRQYGAFVTPWRAQPFLWLLHYMDTKTPNYDYRAITAARIALLPVGIQEAIGPIQ